MQKKSAKRKNNVKNLAVVTTLTAIVLIVSTFAWFIALDEVHVNAFNVTIAPTEGLELSINGTEWFGGADAVDHGNVTTGNLIINDTNYFTGAYTGNTNSWTGIKSQDVDTGTIEHWGLIPMSSSGQIDAASSRLILFEKSSLTSTDLEADGTLTDTEWGYRLLSDPVPNDGADEHRGYIAFDLFVKNTTEDQYYSDVDIQNEEAVYLTIDSKVTPGTDGYGLENSVRVAFAQVARMAIPETGATPAEIGDIDAATAAALLCEDAEGNTLEGAICRPATIWEPNDSKHSANAIEFYNTNCTVRPYTVGGSETCSPLTNGTASPTYAITNNILVADAIDIYDGLFNGYTASSATLDADGTTPILPKIYDMTTTTLLGSYDNKDSATGGLGYYFTDTEKLTGITMNADGVTVDAADQDDRPPLMYLAPSSITKVRVYVWLEGQDIDNYDWASLGKSINVSFGFTKQQLSDELAE